MPSSIAIITDSDASLPIETAARFGIQQVPITVQFGEEIFTTGVDIDDTRLFNRIDREKRLPTTAAPSPGSFIQAFQAAFERGAEAILCFCVSSAVSATYNNALLASQDERFTGRDITVIDTQNLSMTQGFMALAAAEALQAGASKQEALDNALGVGERCHLFAALSTLKYLAMSGRVGHLAAGMAGLLEVKPIMTIRNGKLELLEKVRTRGKSLGRIIDLLQAAAAGRPVQRMAIIHVNALEEGRLFEEKLRATLSCPQEILYAELTPGLSVHSGAGLLGAVIVV